MEVNLDWGRSYHFLLLLSAKNPGHAAGSSIHPRRVMVSLLSDPQEKGARNDRECEPKALCFRFTSSPS